jgi:hypothetical protein
MFRFMQVVTERFPRYIREALQRSAFAFKLTYPGWRAFCTEEPFEDWHGLCRLLSSSLLFGPMSVGP